MAAERIAAALARLEAALRQHPAFGLHEESPAVTRWQGGTKFITSPPGGGPEVLTDLPQQMGGDGEGVTPGWPVRAGLAACVATVIALHAASQGIELTSLEVAVGGRADVRGILGMADEQGKTVSAGPTEMRLEVKIAAAGVSRERLQALVEQANRCSPASSALRQAVPLNLRIEVLG
ncbi:MAG TPA: OsmC family protein [Steroidobacteraceae bacterium]|nr:OsmC family protein [Steroidobacteraceae bacterium]